MLHCFIFCLFSTLDTGKLTACLRGGNLGDTSSSGPLYQAAVENEDYGCTTILALEMDLETFKKVVNSGDVLYYAEWENKMTTAKFLRGKEIFYKTKDARVENVLTLILLH